MAEEEQPVPVTEAEADDDAIATFNNAPTATSVAASTPNAARTNTGPADTPGGPAAMTPSAGGGISWANLSVEDVPTTLRPAGTPGANDKAEEGSEGGVPEGAEIVAVELDSLGGVAGVVEKEAGEEGEGKEIDITMLDIPTREPARNDTPQVSFGVDVEVSEGAAAATDGQMDGNDLISPLGPGVSFNNAHTPGLMQGAATPGVQAVNTPGMLLYNAQTPQGGTPQAAGTAPAGYNALTPGFMPGHSAATPAPTQGQFNMNTPGTALNTAPTPAVYPSTPALQGGYNPMVTGGHAEVSRRISSQGIRRPKQSSLVMQVDIDGAAFLHDPSRRAPHRSNDLIVDLQRRSSVRCVEWSPQNLVVFTSVDGLIDTGIISSHLCQPAKAISPAAPKPGPDSKVHTNPPTSAHSQPAMPSAGGAVGGMGTSTSSVMPPLRRESSAGPGQLHGARTTRADGAGTAAPAGRPIVSRGKSGGLVHPLFVFDPNCPSEHCVIRTPHVCPIKSLSFSALTSAFCWLLSSDDEKVECLWRPHDHVANQWELVRVFDDYDGAVYSRWIYVDGDPEGHNPARQKQPWAKATMGVDKLRGMPAFLSISRAGNVRIRAVSEGRWVTLFTRLQPNRSMRIAHADVTVLRTGTLRIVVHEVSTPVLVYLYSAEFDLDTQRISLHLSSRLQVPTTGFNLLRGQVMVSHVLFDPAANGTRFLCVISNTPPSPTITAIELWEWTQDYAWQSVARHMLIAHGTPMPSDVANAPSRKKETRQAVISPFVTAVNFSRFGGHIVVSYIDGRVELRSSRDLSCLCGHLLDTEPIDPARRPMVGDGCGSPTGKKRRISDVSTGSGHRDSSIEGAPSMLSQCPDHAVSCCFSPNDACVAVLDYSGKVHIVGLTPTVEMPYGAESEGMLTNVMKRALARGNDCWDIASLARSLQDHVRNNEELKNTNVINNILTSLNVAFVSTCDVPYHRHYDRQIESLRSEMYRMMEGFEASFVDSQARLFLLFIEDTMRSHLGDRSQFPKDWPLGLDPEASAQTFKALSHSLLEMGATLRAENDPPAVGAVTLLRSLFPLADWILDYSIFLLGNLSRLYTMVRRDGPNSIISKETNEVIIPGVRFLTDRTGDMLDLLSRNLVYAAVCKVLATFSGDSKVPAGGYALKDIKTVSQLLGYLDTESRSVWGNEQILQSSSLGEKLALQVEGAFRQKRPVMEELGQMDMASRLKKVDLCPPLLGFAERSSKKDENGRTMFQPFVVSGVPVYGADNMYSRRDVVTGERLPMDAARRQCTRCNRVAKQLPNSTVAPAWYFRWQMCCPICGGKWRVCS